MKYNTYSLGEVLKFNADKKLVLPNFQRDFVWPVEKQRTLLASFISGLPIGNILILGGSKDDFAARDLCLPNSLEPHDDCQYLLDGQQRISTLRNIFSDLFFGNKDWKDIWSLLPNQLRYRWFINLDLKDDDVDFLGYKDLIFDSQYLNEIEPNVISNSLVFEKILKQGKQWYHPGFSVEKNGKFLQEREKRIEIINQATSNKKIPLYEIINFSKLELGELHTMVLEKIATNRLSDLKLEVSENNKEINRILISIEPDIEQVVKNGDKNEIEILWMKLSLKWANDVKEYLSKLRERKIASINLPKGKHNRAFAIFETINKGGTPLDEYDLIVAKAARDRDLEPLTQRIISNLEHNISIPASVTYRVHGEKPKNLSTSGLGLYDDKKLEKLTKNQVLNLLSIFSHLDYGKDTIEPYHIKRQKQLELNEKQINKNLKEVVDSIRRTMAFLNIRCGIVKLSELPYKLMFLPIAYCLKDNKIWKTNNLLDKIEYWYWASLFGGHYRDNQNTKAVKDIISLYRWVKDDGKGFESRYDNIFEAEKYSDQKTLNLALMNNDDDIKPPNSISKGILQYVLSNQPVDFLNEQIKITAWFASEEKEFQYDGKTEKLKLNDHHIFPLGAATNLKQSSAELRKDKKAYLNSPLNRTFISSVANRILKDYSPSKYLKFLTEKAPLSHSISANFPSEKNYSDEDCIKMLNERFDKLKEDVKKELSRLVS